MMRLCRQRLPRITTSSSGGGTHMASLYTALLWGASAQPHLLLFTATSTQNPEKAERAALGSVYTLAFGFRFEPRCQCIALVGFLLYTGIWIQIWSEMPAHSLPLFPDSPSNRRNSVKLVSKKDRVQKGGILNIGLNQKRRPLLSALSDFHRSHVDPFRQRRGISPRF